MSCTRRNWIHGFLGAVSFGAFSQRVSEGQDTEIAPKCAGKVSDLQGNGMKGLGVEIVEPNGRVTTGETKAGGLYELPAPKSGPYVILFRERQGKTSLHALWRLTAGTNQKVSVTIDLPVKDFQAAYSALQAVETLSAWIMADRENKVGPTLFKIISYKELTNVVNVVMQGLDQFQPTKRQRQFLSTKAETIRKLVGMVG